MNPMFVVLVILAAILLWALFSFAYVGIGEAFDEIFGSAKRIMKNNSEKKENEEDA